MWKVYRPESQSFNSASADMRRADPDRFENRIREFMDDDTVFAVRARMDELQLPIPERSDEYMKATAGAIIFSNRYGMVVRIECGEESKRQNNNPWVLQPVASFQAGRAVIEICPGVHQADDWKYNTFLVKELKKFNLDFHDEGLRNVGLLPVTSVKFPKGIPVVVDRPAVMLLTQNIAAVRKALSVFGKKSKDPQADLYAPLREAIGAAYQNGTDAPPDKKKMRAFWDLCEKFVEEGKLVAGWNNVPPELDGPGKTEEARYTARNYSKLEG